VFLKENHIHPSFYDPIGFSGQGLAIAQAGLEVEILLPQLSECWDYRSVLTHLAHPVFLLSCGP
jgi:hypothetical protein